MDNNKSSNYLKHTSSKGIRKKLIDNFNRSYMVCFKSLCSSETKNVLDIGCGEGFTLKMIYDDHGSLELTGCDISKSATAHAKTLVPTAEIFINSGYDIRLEDKSFDIVMCSEVLEHVDAPEKMLAEIKRVCRKNVLLSVPHEPYFMLGNMLSGKNIKAFGNDPEHIQHFSITKFKKLCNEYFTEIETRRVFPWIIYTGIVR